MIRLLTLTVSVALCGSLTCTADQAWPTGKPPQPRPGNLSRRERRKRQADGVRRRGPPTEVDRAGGRVFPSVSGGRRASRLGRTAMQDKYLVTHFKGLPEYCGFNGARCNFVFAKSVSIDV